MPRPRRWTPGPFDHGEPIRRIVLAPLAGVLLIAATLVASTYGVPTHAIEIDLPYPSQEPRDTRLGLSPDLLRIDRRGTFYWNGQPVSPDELTSILALRDPDRRSAGLRFSPDPDAPYEIALGALWLVKTSGNAEAGFCFGNHHLHRAFGAAHNPEGREPSRAAFACDPSNDGRFDQPLPYMPTS